MQSSFFNDDNPIIGLTISNYNDKSNINEA